jgi:2-polyprenyl-3-methyl-5-hydroxy-6-metoxy-1,4-benzoquinol methylase
MNCPNCKFVNTKYLYKYRDSKGENFDLRCTSLDYQKPNLIKCGGCDLIFSDLCDLKFENLYQDVVDDLYIDQIPFKKKYFEITLSKVKKYLDKSKDVLEIGSYYGIFGSLISPNVKSYTGLELSGHAVNFAKKKYNLNFLNLTINEYFKNLNNIDIIIMSHVIEHMDDVFNNLDNIKSKMSKESVLIFSTYNMDSLIAKILGKNYHWIMPMHKFYFSKKVLKKILEEKNLEIVETISDTHIISLKYFFIKLQKILPFFKFLFNTIAKLPFLSKINIKINLGDLDIYFVKIK